MVCVLSVLADGIYVEACINCAISRGIMRTVVNKYLLDPLTISIIRIEMKCANNVSLYSVD